MAAVAMVAIVAYGQEGDGAYALGVASAGAVYTVDLTEGRFEVRRWDATRRQFVPVALAQTGKASGSLKDLNIDSPESATLLLSDPQGAYAEWRLSFAEETVHPLLAGNADEELYTIDPAGEGAWVLSGQREVYSVGVHGQCHLLSNDEPMTFSAVRGRVLAVTGRLTTFMLPDTCRSIVPNRTLALRGHTVGIAPTGNGWVGIVSQWGGMRLLLLNERLEPTGTIRLDQRLAWHLTGFGDAAVASAPDSPVAYRLTDRSVSRLKLSAAVHGYVCRSASSTDLWFTDGARLASVADAFAVAPEKGYLVLGFILSAWQIWIVAIGAGAIVAAAVMLVHSRRLPHR